MTKTLIYPAIFHKAEEGGFWIEFPDFPECLTQGENEQESNKMAVDVLKLALDDMQKNGKAFPAASLPETIKTNDGIITLIKVELAD